MSQEKVNKYKEQKANRKETMKKQKRASLIRNVVAAVVLVATVGWVGYSGVTYIIRHQPRQEVGVNYTSVADYVESLTAEDTAPEDVVTEDATTEDATEVTE